MKMKRILSFLLCNMVMFSVFLPSISVQAEEYDSIVTNTTLTPSGNGVDVHLEAYATGDITTIAAITPVDIVLVLDQSSSMKDSLGNSTKQKVLKNVVSNFIDSVAEQFDASTSDHRMSIVTVSNNATVKTNWTFVNDTGKTSLKNSIDSLSASNNSAAMFDKGMEKVKELLGTNYGYSGENTTRYKAVIVFTDGVPSNGNTNSFSTAIADDALELAKAIKDNGATIYSVGLFDGADPYQLYGDVWGYTAFEDIPCSGETGSLWGGSTITSLLTSGVKPVDAPAANRFLNYLSSNFLATSIGITWVTGKNPGNHEIFGIAVTGNGYQITANFPAVKSGYYLVADGADSLNAIFQSISYQIATSNVSLGSDTSIKAVIPETFTLPASAGDVHVYTAAYSGSGNSFAQKVNATGMTVTIDEATRTISVKGFNYKNDFISTAKKADNTYGKKLIIEYHLDTAPGFLGGNNIPLGNILMLDEEGVIAKSFPQTQVNIPIQNVTVTPAVKNVYLNGGISAADLLSGTTAAVGTTAL
ncbi:MAG: VWA domain-containing protein, partial [Lachnospiraceae bacterium]|nr:VWA domain-containing protein [Lachnospiraceae bacterium]